MTWGRRGGRALAVVVVAASLAVTADASLLERRAETGGASWYGTDFDGKTNANGERFDAGRMTAARIPSAPGSA